MTRSTMPAARALAVAAVAAVTLAACGSGESTTEQPTPSATPSPSSTVSVPPTVNVTPAGADMAFGDSASVIYEPDEKRGTVLQLTVDKATKGSVKDFSSFILDDYTRAATPYYVDVTVKNVGESDVGGAPVPLWGVDADDTLLPAATFTTSFPKCASEPLPKKFAPGASTGTCLVYLAPEGGTLTGVSFRPDQDFDPIQWTGDITTPKPDPKKTKKHKTKG